jgi:hypothetical protein
MKRFSNARQISFQPERPALTHISSCGRFKGERRGETHLSSKWDDFRRGVFRMRNELHDTSEQAIKVGLDHVGVGSRLNPSLLVSFNRQFVQGRTTVAGHARPNISQALERQCLGPLKKMLEEIGSEDSQTRERQWKGN